MDATGFDTLTRSLTGPRSRRSALASLLAGTLGLPGLAQIEARNKRKKKSCPPCKKRKKGKCKGKVPDGTACPAGTCQAGACVALPCAGACAAGCCTAAGACLPGDATEACGASGGTCQNCADQGQLCIDGQCRLEQQSCFPGSCGECLRCNDTQTACVEDPFTAGTPCSQAICGAGEAGRCDGGQCQCEPVQTCLDASCDECWACNDTRSGCVIDLSMEGAPCDSVTCEVGEMALCTGGQCQCQ